ncbi:hypothetical protein [Parasphingopyxis sp.]|uniref:hypothetical protein n=1 Tax=Parasphingopyxis sp. TaxID=1920299 RepID=UPI00260EE608|nr:hypothetical protein [Parasphingopyxis sp.]
MTIIGKTLMGATAATALAVAAPAQASNNDGIDGGDILAGVLVLGGLAAVIAAVSDDDDDRYEHYDRRYDGPYARNHRGHYYGHGRLRPRQAINRCAIAAQQRASRYGRAQITEITDVDRARGGYRVEGRVVVEENRFGRRGYYRTAGYDRGRFSCRIRYGQIDRLRVSGLG